MIGEICLVGVILYVLFGDIIRAKAYEIHENARRMELENDQKEFDHDHREEV